MLVSGKPRLNALITGGAGFIGGYLAGKLIEQGANVRCYDNLSSGRRENTTHLFEGDILDPNRLRKAMAGCDVVWHLAANTDTRAGVQDPTKDLFNGLVGTYNVLLAMLDLHINKIVFTSTCGVYGDSPEPASETSPVNPICPYADNKLKAEWLIEYFAARAGFQVWILRLGNAVGRVMQNGVIRDLVRKLKADPTKLDVLGSKKPCRAFMSVEDCVDGMLFAFDNAPKQVHPSGTERIYNIAGSQSTNIGKIVELLLKELELDIPVSYEPQDQGWKGSAVEVKMNVDKINSLGWEAKMSSNMAVKKAIREIVEFEKVIGGTK